MMLDILSNLWHYTTNLTNLIGLIFLLLSFKPKKYPMDKSNYFSYWRSIWLTATRPEEWAKVYKAFRMDEMEQINAIEKSPVQPKGTKKVTVQQLTLWATFIQTTLIPLVNFIMGWFGKLSSRTQKIIVLLTLIGVVSLGVWYFYLRT